MTADSLVVPGLLLLALEVAGAGGVWDSWWRGWRWGRETRGWRWHRVW